MSHRTAGNASVSLMSLIAAFVVAVIVWGGGYYIGLSVHLLFGIALTASLITIWAVSESCSSGQVDALGTDNLAAQTADTFNSF